MAPIDKANHILSTSLYKEIKSFDLQEIKYNT